MNLPNKLTMARIIVVPVIILMLQAGVKNDFFNYIAMVLFVAASVTDFVDGYIARKYQMITDFGKLMDPLADKVLVLSLLIVFGSIGYISPWFAILTIAREFLVTGIRSLAAAKGKVIPAINSGKYKTASQMVVIFFVMILKDSWLSNALMLIPLALTIYSGYEVVKNGKKYFMEGEI